MGSKNAIASVTDDALRRKSADSEMTGSEVHAAGMDISARCRYELGRGEDEANVLTVGELARATWSATLKRSHRLALGGPLAILFEL